MNESASYNITVRFGEFDGESCYEARVKELPDITEYADSFQEAYELALDSITTTANLLAEIGRTMPAPAHVTSDYSGRVTLRIPKTLHGSLAQMADDEGVSLNQLMVSVLAAFRGFGSAMDESGAGWMEVIDCEKAQSPVRTSTNIVSFNERKYPQVANW